MKTNLMFQNEENKLSKNITDLLENNPKKAYFFIGSLKDNGFKIIEDGLIDNKVKSTFVIGIDKKYTTKSMLEDILRYTSDVKFYSNNNVVEFDANVMVFEYTNTAIMILSSGSVSENSLNDNINIYTKVEYDLKDKEEAKQYKDNIKEILKSFDAFDFQELTSKKIEELVESKEIFSTRQYQHNVMSISELLGKKKEEKEELKEKNADDDIVKGDVEIPKVDLSDDFDFEFDIPEEEVTIKKEEKSKSKEEKSDDEKEDLEDVNIEEVKEDNFSFDDIAKDFIDTHSDLYDESMEDMDFDENGTLDINSMLFSKSDMKLDVSNNDANKNEEEKEESVKVKKVNLTNVSNYIYELPNKPSKGQDLVNLKVPMYIQNLIPEFFLLSEKGKNVEIDGVQYKERNITLEIIDVNTNEKYIDKRAKIIHKANQTYLTITSDYLKDIKYQELDIARIIKLSDDVYHVEFISKDLQEYKVWDKLCTQTFKSSTKKYGMM